MTEQKFDLSHPFCEDFIYNFNNVNEFIEAFRREFTYIVVYHGTNLTDLEYSDILTNGLKKTSKELLLKRAKERFEVNLKNLSDIENILNTYFDEYELYTKDEINFCLAEEDILKHYHYLLFGSESLLSLADHLKKIYRQNFRKALVESGSHYIIKAILPVNKIQDFWIKSIYESLQQNVFSIALVYHYDLSSNYIVEIKKVNTPEDLQNLLLI